MIKDEGTFGYILNSQFVHREGDPPLFECNDERLKVQMDGYLVCPKEMFTKRQLKAAMKKYHDKTLASHPLSS